MDQSLTLHHVSLKQIEVLEGIFAYLTEDGWIIPDWLKLMRATARH
jgi:hypothetical protein